MPLKPGWWTRIELMHMQLSLRLESDVGEAVQASAAEFSHNEATDEQIMAEFDRQCAGLKKQVELYLARRCDRSKVEEESRKCR